MRKKILILFLVLALTSEQCLLCAVSTLSPAGTTELDLIEMFIPQDVLWPEEPGPYPPNPYIMEQAINAGFDRLDEYYGNEITRRIDDFCKRNPASKKARILMIGVGRGFEAFELMKKYGNRVHVVATNNEDLLYRTPEKIANRSLGAIDKVEAEALIKKLRKNYIRCDLSKGIALIQKFDMVVLCTNVIKYVPQDSNTFAFNAMYNVCKEGGIIYLDFHDIGFGIGSKLFSPKKLFDVLGPDLEYSFCNDNRVSLVKGSINELPFFNNIALEDIVDFEIFGSGFGAVYDVSDWYLMIIIKKLLSSNPDERSRAVQNIIKYFPELKERIGSYFASLPVTSDVFYGEKKLRCKNTVVCTIRNRKGVTKKNIKRTMKKAVRMNTKVVFAVDAFKFDSLRKAGYNFGIPYAEAAREIYEETGMIVDYALHLTGNKSNKKKLQTSNRHTRNLELQLVINRVRNAIKDGFRSFTADALMPPKKEMLKIKDMKDVLWVLAEIIAEAELLAWELGVKINYSISGDFIAKLRGKNLTMWLTGDKYYTVPVKIFMDELTKDVFSKVGNIFRSVTRVDFTGKEELLASEVENLNEWVLGAAGKNDRFPRTKAQAPDFDAKSADQPRKLGERMRSLRLPNRQVDEIENLFLKKILFPEEEEMATAHKVGIAASEGKDIQKCQ